MAISSLEMAQCQMIRTIGAHFLCCEEPTNESRIKRNERKRTRDGKKDTSSERDECVNKRKERQVTGDVTGSAPKLFPIPFFFLYSCYCVTITSNEDGRLLAIRQARQRGNCSSFF